MPLMIYFDGTSRRSWAAVQRRRLNADERGWPEWRRNLGKAQSTRGRGGNGGKDGKGVKGEGKGKEQAAKGKGQATKGNSKNRMFDAQSTKDFQYI